MQKKKCRKQKIKLSRTKEKTLKVKIHIKNIQKNIPISCKRKSKQKKKVPK